ncbi:hypothetical protein BH23CHL7_BH23CHL7_17320 [soil metagenome]
MSGGMEIKRASWDVGALLRSVDGASRRAEARAGEAVRQAADRRVPYRTGALAASGSVEVTDEGAAVSYGTEYARVLHAHPEWNYGGRSGRWLADAVDEAATDVGGLMADELRSGWPGG